MSGHTDEAFRDPRWVKHANRKLDRQWKKRPPLPVRRGEDATGIKTSTGRKKKNAGQLENPADRRARALGPVGRFRKGIGGRPKGKQRTAADPRNRKGSLEKGHLPKGSPKAKRRQGNRDLYRRQLHKI